MSVMGTRRRARLRPSRRGGESPGPRATRHSRSARAPRRRGGARGCRTSRRRWRRSRSAHTSAGARRGPARASTAAPIAACSAGSGARRGPCRPHPRSARRTIRSFRGTALDRARLLAGRVVQVRLDGRGRLVEQPRDLGDRPALVAVVLRLQHLAPAPHAAVIGISTRCASLHLARSHRHLLRRVQSVGQHGRPHSFWPDRPLTACRLSAPARSGRRRTRRLPSLRSGRLAAQNQADARRNREGWSQVDLTSVSKDSRPARSLPPKAGAGPVPVLTTACRPRQASRRVSGDDRFCLDAIVCAVAYHVRGRVLALTTSSRCCSAPPRCAWRPRARLGRRRRSTRRHRDRARAGALAGARLTRAAAASRR